MAVPDDKGDTGSGNGASYNQQTGEASIVTDEKDGEIKTTGASIDKWRVKTPASWPELLGSYWGFTPTQYVLEHNNILYDAGLYNERDWSSGAVNGTVTHSKEQIEELVNNAVTFGGMITGVSKDKILDEGFTIHIYACVFAIKPGHAFEDTYIELFLVKYDKNMMTFKNGVDGFRTWIANVVDRCAANLGVTNEGYAYYNVPPRVALAPVGNNSNITGDLILSEKRITKAYDLTSFGSLTDFGFSYSSTGSHSHRVDFRNKNGTPLDTTDDFDDYYYDDYDRSTPVDSSYKYVVQASNSLNTNAITTLGGFVPKYVNNTKTGTASWSGGSSTLTPNLQFSVWRANDLPTLASYKENVNNPLVKDLGLPIGKTPQKPRNTTGGYKENISIQLRQSNDDGADYSTTFTDGDDSATQIHSTVDTADYNAILGVQSFIGVANKGDNGSTFSSSSFVINGIRFNTARGYAVPSGNLIKFYPYVQMAYDLPGNTASIPVNVLAGYESTIKPVDYIEVGWTNTNTTNSLTLNSNQWSTHARAVSKWGKNSVLPGGAIYTLDTKANASKVGVTTWQTYIPNDLLGALTAGDSYFSLDAAIARDNDINNQIKASIEALDVVQYIDKDPTKSNAFSGIKLNAAGGQDVYGNKTSSDPKYWLKRGTAANSNYANEADLDIINESGKTRTYYKVESDINGNVAISKCTDGVNWIILETLSKTQTAANITKVEVNELDNRTKLITNFISAIDRNKGSDKTINSYVVSGDDKWYNEAWEGVIVMKTDTVYTVGFNKPVTRSVALDPKLTPPKDSASDVFMKAYLSQFRLNDKPTIHSGKVSGFVARHNEVDIVMPEMQNMYVSRTFYIPNATVMDLH